MFLLHTNVFAGEGPTFSAVKPIKIYTFRILELDRKKDQERPYLNHLGLARESLRSKRFRLVSEQRNTEEGDFRFWPREKWNESQKVKNPNLNSNPPPRSFTSGTFLAVCDSRSSFFSPKPHRNACYTGVPDEHFSQNWLYDVVNASKVLLRQPMLIFNFPGKKYPLFTASQQDFQKLKIPASNHVCSNDNRLRRKKV